MISRAETRQLLDDFEIERALEFLQADPGEDAKLDLVRAIAGALQRQRREFPAAQAVGRVGDMAPNEKSHMVVMLDGDSDVIVEVWDAETGLGSRAAIEFCTGIGGGKSPHTRSALLALMVAMERDNAESPRFQFPPAQSGK